ncbi:MAG TPA: heme-copper oxidase subunit III [Polyangia bacterium]|nr:heme-copper oxidase subunit III [Polyangia bacterium]
MMRSAEQSVALPPRGLLGMWIFLGTDAAGFGGLMIAYGALRARAVVWPDPYQRFSLALAAAMTFALLASSLTVALAVSAAQRGNRRAALAWLAATVLAGLAFLVGAEVEYTHLLSAVPRIGLSTDLPASVFYVITGFHGAHVVAGLVYLGALLIGQARAPRLSPATWEVAALFWHFVDFAWVAIFFALYLLPAA